MPARRCGFESRHSHHFMAYDEARRKAISEGVKRSWREDPSRYKTEKYINSPANRKKSSDRLKAAHLARRISTPWDCLSYAEKRRRVIDEQLGKCCVCGISEWLGKPIVLEYEHKDGDRGNNDRDNVCAMCPNCHSQTPTWRRNKNAIGNSARMTNKHAGMGG